MFFLYTRRALILFISFLSITLTKTTKSKSKLTDRVKIQFLIWSDFRQILQSCPLGSHNVYLGKKNMEQVVSEENIFLHATALY